MKRIAVFALLVVGQAILPVLGRAQGQAGLPVLQLRDYIAGLERIRAATDTTSARTMAEQLVDREVDSPAGRFRTDSALLHEVMASPKSAEPHLAATIAALRGGGSEAPLPVVDPRLINHLRVEQSPPELQSGGEVDLAPAGDEKTLEKVGGWLTKGWRRIKKQWNKLANWFDKWWPKSRLPEEAKKPRGTVRGVVIAIVVAIVIVIAVLAYEVVRRSRAAMPAPLVKSDALTSKRDDDPLSRGATEWERYAAQLAASGRIREAIRAWYHAVLVTLYGAGILHFRKGRTNWEYVAALSPDLAWRAQFVALTRRFEEEWYGRDRSSIEAFEEVSERAQHILDAVRRRAAA